MTSANAREEAADGVMGMMLQPLVPLSSLHLHRRRD